MGHLLLYKKPAVVAGFFVLYAFLFDVVGKVSDIRKEGSLEIRQVSLP